MEKIMKKSLRITTKESMYLEDVLRNGFPGSSEISYVKKLEELFAEKFQSEFAISFCNGTATLHAALHAAGIQPGDEVVVPPLTMASTSLAVLHQGAIPVFADIDPETFTISPESVKERISSRTKAIIPVSIYGLSPDMDPIMKIAEERKLTVIEDNAQCFLGKYKEKIVGSIGHMASFSFQNSKHITCGEGGIVITSDEKSAERIRRFSSLGYGLVAAKPGASKIDKKSLVRPDFKRHTDFGYNYRLSELCAAVAYAQLERLEEFVSWRERCAHAFEEVINSCSWLKAQMTPYGYKHTYWAYTIRLDNEAVNWQDFYDQFAGFGGEGFYGAWSLTYLEPYFEKIGLGVKGLCPTAEKIQPYLIQLKTNYMKEEDIKKQAEALNKTIRYFDE